jgi:hypothetical protein
MASGIIIGGDLWINPDHIAQCEHFSPIDNLKETCIVRFKQGGPDRCIQGEDAARFWADLRVYHTANPPSVHSRKTLLLDPDPLDKIRNPEYAENPETLNR